MTRMSKAVLDSSRLPQRLQIDYDSKKEVGLAEWSNPTMLSKYPLLNKQPANKLPDLSNSPINSPSTPNLSPDFNYPLELCNEELDSNEHIYLHPDYRVLKTLGSGATSQVYLAVPLRLNVPLVALKVVCKSELLDSLVEHEVEVLEKLDHNNVIKMFDYSTDSCNHFIATECCKDGDLFDYVNSNYETFSSSTVVNIFDQCVSAVHYLHTKSYLHRDLKLENFLVASTNPLTIKLADFGMAMHTSNPLPMSQLPKGGSDQYLAPELLITSDYLYDLRRCDVYALGILLYALLFNRLPFNYVENDPKSRKTMLINIFNSTYKVPSQVAIPGTESLLPLMRQMMQTKPEKRPELKNVLETLSGLK